MSSRSVSPLSKHLDNTTWFTLSQFFDWLNRETATFLWTNYVFYSYCCFWIETDYKKRCGWNYSLEGWRWNAFFSEQPWPHGLVRRRKWIIHWCNRRGWHLRMHFLWKYNYFIGSVTGSFQRAVSFLKADESLLKLLCSYHEVHILPLIRRGGCMKPHKGFSWNVEIRPKKTCTVRGACTSQGFVYLRVADSHTWAEQSREFWWCWGAVGEIKRWSQKCLSYNNMVMRPIWRLVALITSSHLTICAVFGINPLNSC